MELILHRTESTAAGNMDVYRLPEYEPATREELGRVLADVQHHHAAEGSQRMPEIVVVHHGSESVCNSVRDIEELCQALGVSEQALRKAIGDCNGSARLVLDQETVSSHA